MVNMDDASDGGSTAGGGEMELTGRDWAADC